MNTPSTPSRVLPLSTYRDPNYDSDSSFENYYLNYAEEQTPALHHDRDDQPVTVTSMPKEVPVLPKCDRPTWDGHDIRTEIDTKKRRIIYEDLSALKNIRRERSAIRRRKRTHSSRLWDFIPNVAAPDKSSSSDHPQENKTRVANDREPALFIRRVLQNADMNRQQHRLSMPCKQVKIDACRLFTRDEWTTLTNTSPVGAKLIDPRGQEYDINLRLSKSGPSTYCYAIGKPWLQIVDDNGLQPEMVLDVRVSRIGDHHQLCFFLQRVA